MTITPHPTDPAYAAVRGALARLFLDHKRDLDLTDWPDSAIVARVDDIAAALIGATAAARQTNDSRWLAQHRWWLHAARRLLQDESPTAFDA